jgi:hypothetical protein
MLSVFGWIVRRTSTEVRENGSIAGNAMIGSNDGGDSRQVSVLHVSCSVPTGLKNCTPTDTGLA